MIKHQKWQIEHTLIKFKDKVYFSYKFPNKERGVWLEETNHERQMMLKKRPAICTNGWKRKQKLILLRKKLLMHSLPAGQKHDSLAWFFGNKIYIWGKIKICIYFFLLKGLWKECFLMSWREICHRIEKKFNLLQTFKGEMKEAQRGSKFTVEFSFVCQNVVLSSSSCTFLFLR